MILLIPEGTESHFVEGLPDSVELAYLPKEGALSAKAQAAEFALAPYNGGKYFFPALPQLTQLKVVQTFTAGVDWILPKMPPGVTLCDAAGVHDIPVSEWIMAAVLGAIKRFPQFRDAQREQQWLYQWTDDLEGSSVLFLGYGSIAKATERRMEPFGVQHFIRVARTARENVHAFSELGQLLPQADIVINLLPHTPQTHQLFSAAHFAAMKKGALYVNAGRGKTVDEAALVQAVRSGHIRLVTDVTETEPLPEGHPLWSLPEVFITPHMAGSTPKLYQRGFRLLREQVGRYVRGEPLINVVSEGY